MWWSVLVGVALALQPATERALAVGDCGPALADTADGPAEQLALARCQLSAAQPGRALETLQPIAGPLSDYAGIIAAQAHLAQSDPAAALDALEGVSLSGLSGQLVLQLRGIALIQAGRYIEGRDVLRPLLLVPQAHGSLSSPGIVPAPGGADPAEVRWWLAEGAVRRGDPQLAPPVWQSIWARNPSSVRAEQAAQRLDAVGSPVPDTTTAQGRRLIETRIQALQRQQRHPEALELLDTLPDVDPHRMSAAVFAAKDYPRAVVLYRALPDPTPQERFNHALAASRAGDYPLAATLYRALIATVPNHRLADTASYKLGYLAYDSGQLPQAIELFTQHLTAHPGSRHTDQTRWFIAWSWFRLGQLDKADAALQQLGTSQGDRATYWRARIAGLQGHTDDEQRGLERVLTHWPDSGYAWFSARRLGRTWPAPSPAPEAQTPPALQPAMDLARVGLFRWARNLIPRSGEPAEAWAAARLAVGQYPLARARLSCADPPSPTARAACLPRPAHGLIDPITITAHLPRNLPYAIMTAESALQPEVTSPAGARGLMQLMPAVAAPLHATQGPNRPFHPDELYLPNTNATLGTLELARLRAHFASLADDTAIPLVIASYNAGEDAVDRWLGEWPAADELQADVFAEDISYTETRHYVQRVLGYLARYERVYGSDPTAPR